jgi:F420-non-reducing hydrogenase iron-sulfur subunit
MDRASVPDVVVNLCHQCVPGAENLPRQWTQEGAFVLLREIPCSGKIDLQYLLHAIGEVRGGVCVVACPRGGCHLAQGNRRAEVRVGTLKKLLGEAGLEPERVELLHCEPGATEPSVRGAVRDAVRRLAALRPNPALEIATASAPPPAARSESAIPARAAPSRRAEPAPIPAVASDGRRL